MRLINGFVEDLERTLNVTKTELSLRDLWKEETPLKADNLDIDAYLKDVR